MCGITGAFNLKNSISANTVIKTMTDALAHRGPDSEGFFVDHPKIALGHRRLSIIDLSTSANQPFSDNSGRYVLVFNGEIYNYLDVKPLLTDYDFKTTSDTEVILAAYIKWGKDCLRHLNGMFAFAIWDKKKEELFIARDRLGVKPFYYYHDGQTFVFASELRSILQSGLVRRRVEEKALRDYLVFQSVYAPYTLIKEVYQLMPGECGFVSEQRFDKHIYWSVEKPSPQYEIPDAQTAQKKVRELLTASVSRRMISDVPLGAFLSGGIDSSAVVALMAETSERPIDTFTVVFDEKEFDESHFANIIAKKFKTHHTKIRLTPADFLKELPEALDAVDAPSGDGLNTYIVSKVTKQAGITVALSGLGGDELFAGYNYFNHFQKIRSSLSMYWKLPHSLRSPLVGLAGVFLPKNQKSERILKILRAKEPTMAEIYPLFRLVNTEKEANNLLKNRTTALPLIIADLLTEREKDIRQLPVLSQVTTAELLGYTLNVLLRDTDQFSMASALEVREPFFDFPLVEYVLNVPDAFKTDPSIPKSLLVKALDPLLPNEIYNRPKMGFSFPWKEWLLNDLRTLCETNLDYLKNCQLFNADAVQAQWTLFLNSKGEKISWVKIWQLVVLSHWLKKNQIEC
ncbi:MAG: asparagine synthase (glutamine-hydrolyzing) [Saprospiraceae bacterium]|nr:asparagine synthase (glutamine-hydrolyzing) [Saprospiraceae bacterium]